MEKILGNLRRAKPIASAFLAPILESKIGGPIQRFRMSGEAGRESIRLGEAANQTGFPVLTRENSSIVSRIGRQKKVFILGSGASSLELGPKHFLEIAKTPSIGFGAWPLHSFVPDMLAFGPTRGLQDYRKVFTEVMGRIDIVDAMPEVLLLRSSLPEDLSMYASLPRPHRPKARIYGRVSALSRTTRGLGAELQYFFNAGYEGEFAITFDSGATLLRMISLAIKSGATEVVLVGVDLNTPDYFWERDPSFLHANGFDSFETGQRLGSHSTMQDERRPLPIDLVIAEVARMFRTVSGGILSVVSETSALSEFLPLYEWESKA